MRPECRQAPGRQGHGSSPHGDSERRHPGRTQSRVPEAPPARRRVGPIRLIVAMAGPGQAGSDWLRPGSTRPAVASLRVTGPRQGCSRVLFVLYTRTCCSESRALTRAVQVPSHRDMPVLVTCACPARAPTHSTAMVRVLSESCPSPVCSLARALCPLPCPNGPSPFRVAAHSVCRQHRGNATGKRTGKQIPATLSSESPGPCTWTPGLQVQIPSPVGPVSTGNALHRRTRKIHSGSCERQGVVKLAREKHSSIKA
jgi:hypothetical protein